MIHGVPQTRVRSVVVFHSAARSGPARTLAPRVAWLAGLGHVEVLFPERGAVEREYQRVATTRVAAYAPLSLPRWPIPMARLPRALIR
ncbi:MAG: hypothetical protein ACRDIB_06030, partial [Ardenticatenaceae bacterium]